MRVFLTKWVARYTRGKGIALASIREAVARAERGLVDAELGGGLIQQRVARPGKGRSGGYRMVIAYRRADRAAFLLAFAKNEQDNITASELQTTRELAARLLAMDTAELQRVVQNGELEEVSYDF